MYDFFFVLHFGNGVFYIYRFLCVEPSLQPRINTTGPWQVSPSVCCGMWSARKLLRVSFCSPRGSQEAERERSGRRGQGQDAPPWPTSSTQALPPESPPPPSSSTSLGHATHTGTLGTLWIQYPWTYCAHGLLIFTSLQVFLFLFWFLL